jgi:hypothetical protein
MGMTKGVIAGESGHAGRVMIVPEPRELFFEVTKRTTVSSPQAHLDPNLFRPLRRERHDRTIDRPSIDG